MTVCNVTNAPKAIRWQEQILTLITRSPAPVTNHSLPGSTSIHLTQPWCPLITCRIKPHIMSKHHDWFKPEEAHPVQLPWGMPAGFWHGGRLPRHKHFVLSNRDQGLVGPCWGIALRVASMWLNIPHTGSNIWSCISTKWIGNTCIKKEFGKKFKSSASLPINGPCSTRETLQHVLFWQGHTCKVMRSQDALNNHNQNNILTRATGIRMGACYLCLFWSFCNMK